MPSKGVAASHTTEVAASGVFRVTTPLSSTTGHNSGHHFELLLLLGVELQKLILAHNNLEVLIEDLRNFFACGVS